MAEEEERSLSRRKGRGGNKRLSDPSSSSSSSSTEGGKVRALFFPLLLLLSRKGKKKKAIILSLTKRQIPPPLPPFPSPLSFPKERYGIQRFSNATKPLDTWISDILSQKNIRRIHCVDLRWREAQCGRRYLLLLFHCRGITFSCWLFPPPLNVRCESRYFDHGEKEKGESPLYPRKGKEALSFKS